MGIEFLYQGSRTKSTGRIIGDTAPYWTDGRSPIYEHEDYAYPVRDGIYVGMRTCGNEGGMHREIVVFSVKSGFNDSVIFGSSDDKLSGIELEAKGQITTLSTIRVPDDIDISGKQRIRGVIRQALARDVLQRQREGRFPATLPTRYGPPPPKRRG